jgi:hypothetical protein
VGLLPLLMFEIVSLWFYTVSFFFKVFSSCLVCLFLFEFLLLVVFFCLFGCLTAFGESPSSRAFDCVKCFLFE